MSGPEKASDHAHTTKLVKSIPDCDFCIHEKYAGFSENAVFVKPATIDGKTRMGPWATMCDIHYAMYGIGLGLGKGQRFILDISLPKAKG